MKVRFEARSHAECTAKMRELCNDGRCWTVYEVFGSIHAKPHATPRNVPRTPAGSDRQYDSIYWQNGEWHNRLPATAAMIRREQEAADNAAGVSDGAASLTRKGNDRLVRRSLRASVVQVKAGRDTKDKQ